MEILKEKKPKASYTDRKKNVLIGISTLVNLKA
jgi:hypothetical protein